MRSANRSTVLHSGIVTVPCLLLVLAGCGTSGPAEEPDRPPAATPVTPSSATGTAAEREALSAYRGMWAAWVAAGRTSNPDAPALRSYTSGKALKLIVSVLATNRHKKHITLGDISIDPKVAVVKPSDMPAEAIIKDCVNDEKWLMHKSSGGLVDDVPGGRHSMTATVTIAEGSWRVTDFELGRTGTC